MAIELLTMLMYSALQVHAGACRAKQQPLGAGLTDGSKNHAPDAASSVTSIVAFDLVVANKPSAASSNQALSTGSPKTPHTLPSVVHASTAAPSSDAATSPTDKQAVASSVMTAAKSSANSVPSTRASPTSIASVASTMPSSGGTDTATAAANGTFGITVTQGPGILSYASGTVASGRETFTTYVRIYSDSSYDAGVLPAPNDASLREWQTAFSAFHDAPDPSCQVPTDSVVNGVAISTAIMSRTFVGSRSIFCGQKLTLKLAGGSSIPATVVDSCGACSPNPFGRVDLTPNAAKAMVPGGFTDGVHLGSWSFDDAKYGALWAKLAPLAEQIPVPGSPSLGAITDRNGAWIPSDFQR